jgi:hypothetical protein
MNEIGSHDFTIMCIRLSSYCWSNCGNSRQCRGGVSLSAPTYVSHHGTCTKAGRHLAMHRFAAVGLVKLGWWLRKRGLAFVTREELSCHMCAASCVLARGRLGCFFLFLSCLDSRGVLQLHKHVSYAASFAAGCCK